MSLERHDWSQEECQTNGNTWYVTKYMDWITPQVYGGVCDIGSGLGYPTLKYAESDKVTSIITNDKFIDEDKTTKHSKIKRLVLTTEEFMNTEQPLFDCITCTEHIEHLIPDTQFKLLDWVKTHLKPGGLFLGSMPDVERSANPWHIKEYTHEQWEEILHRYFNYVEVVVLLKEELYVWKAYNR
jgi:2-polyprenyl-3-methyl-5-hydroxy-6-metoxy-1,4-benzoquinol methylase